MEISTKDGKFEGLLSDERPFKAIYDGYQDAWYVTFTFSSEDIELYEKDDFILLLEPELGKHGLSKDRLKEFSAGIKRDELGCRMWSVTIAID